MSGGASYTRLKTWATTEDITPTDLNAEFNQVLNNSDPGGLGDDSVNVAEMRLQVSPGTFGSESLATNLAGELRRLRYVISRLIGGDNSVWYDLPDSSISELFTLASLGNSIPTTRMVSGRVRTTSEQPLALVPHGTNATVTLKAGGSNPSFVAQIESVALTLTADVANTTLGLAPSTNNTCLVDDGTLAAAEATKFVGERGTTLTVDSMGTEIQSLVGKYAAFMVGTEYFIAFVQSTTTLTKVYRGYFFDSADAPIPRVTISNNDAITLKRLTWLFLSSAGVLSAVYTNPVWSFDQPSAPATGDYWFDLSALAWKTYNGSSFVAATSILVGVSVQDTTGCKAARTFEYFKAFSELNTASLEYVDSNTVRSENKGNQVSVWGARHRFEHNFPVWSMTTDLDTGVTDANSTTYYLYLTEDGDEVISNIRPYDRRYDLMGEYHPHQSWRCLGEIANDGSANFSAISLRTYGQLSGDLLGDSSVKHKKQAVRTITTDGSDPGIGGISVSANCGDFTTTSAGAAITNFSCTLSSKGNPICLKTIADGTSTTLNSAVTGAPGWGTDTDVLNSVAGVKVLRDGNIVATMRIVGTQQSGSVGTTNNAHASPNSFYFEDYVAAGTYVYTLELFSQSVNCTAAAIQMKMVAKEL